MRLTVLVLLFANSIFPISAIDGEWVFENYLSQTITPGAATIQPLESEVIQRIIFTQKIVNSRNGAKLARITILDKNNNYITYDAEYGDFNPVYPIRIRLPKLIDLMIYTSKIDETSMWYSIALSNDAIKKNEIAGAGESETSFFNILGIIRRRL